MEQDEVSHSDDAIERAEAFGIDVSLLKSNLRLTPTERLVRFQQMLDSVNALRDEAARWRERHEPVE